MSSVAEVSACQQLSSEGAYRNRVRFVEKLPPKWRSLAQEIVKFGLIGGVNTVITFVLFNALLPMGGIKATVISSIIATTASYFLNRHWTYRHLPKKDLRREYTLFFLFNIIGMGIDSAFMGLAIYGLGFSRTEDVLALNAFKLVGLAVGTAFRFWSYRTFVFGAKNAGATEMALEAAINEDPAPVSPAPATAPVPATDAVEAADAVDEAFADILAADALDEKTDTSTSQRLR